MAVKLKPKNQIIYNIFKRILFDFLCSILERQFKIYFIIIDVFSKQAFTAYLKTKSSPDMIQDFERVMTKIGKFHKRI